MLPVAAALPTAKENELPRIARASVNVKPQAVLLVENPLGEAQQSRAHFGAVGLVEIKGRHNCDGHGEAFADSLRAAVMGKACV